MVGTYNVLVKMSNDAKPSTTTINIPVLDLSKILDASEDILLYRTPL